MRSANDPWNTTWPPRSTASFVAKPADVGHAVRNEDRRLALGLAAKNDFVQQLAGREIHAFGRLVEHQQLGIVDQGLGQGQPLEHALAVGGDRFAGAIVQADFVQQPRNPRRQFPPGHAATGRRSNRGTPGPSSTAERPGFRADSRRGPACCARPRRGPAAGSFPEVGRQIDNSALTSVVLPARFGPSRPNTQPPRTLKLTSRRAWIARRRSRPDVVGLADVLEFNDRSCHGGTSLCVTESVAFTGSANLALHPAGSWQRPVAGSTHRCWHSR